MQMTNEEIVRDYNAAKNKSKQIKVLADLNQTSPSEIRTILADAGVEGVKKPEKIMPRKKQEAVPAPEPASAPAEDPYSRIETILDAVPKNASEYMRSNAVNLVTSMFTDYVERRLGRVEARPQGPESRARQLAKEARHG